MKNNTFKKSLTCTLIGLSGITVQATAQEIQQQPIAQQDLQQTQQESHVDTETTSQQVAASTDFQPLDTQPLDPNQLDSIEQAIEQTDLPQSIPADVQAKPTELQQVPTPTTNTEQTPPQENTSLEQVTSPEITNEETTNQEIISTDLPDETPIDLPETSIPQKAIYQPEATDQPNLEQPQEVQITPPEGTTPDSTITSPDATETPIDTDTIPQPIPDSKPELSNAEKLLAKVAPAYRLEAVDANNDFANSVNNATWYKGMKVNPYTTIKLQILLDWNHASPGPIDSGWGMNSRKALRAAQEKHGLEVNGRLTQELWDKLNEGELANRHALVSYTITEQDVKTRFRPTARGYEGKAKMRRLSYRNIYEMFGERFHMNVNFLKKINQGIEFKEGNKITVVNVGKHNTTEIDKVIADKKKETLYAYSGDKLVATYPTTVGSRKTPSPKGKHRIVNKVYMPYYNATSKTDPKKKWVLPPGPNNPVGTVWIALSKRSYGIHGSPRPEGISRQASAGCVRLTNWDAAELYSTIKKGATIEFKD